MTHIKSPLPPKPWPKNGVPALHLETTSTTQTLIWTITPPPPGFNIDRKVRTPNTPTSTTALEEATRSGYTDIVSLLLTHRANPNLQNENLDTPLHLAVSNNDHVLVKMLLNAGANIYIRNRRKRYCGTVLWQAAEGEKWAVFVLLLHGPRCRADQRYLLDVSAGLEMRGRKRYAQFVELIRKEEDYCGLRKVVGLWAKGDLGVRSTIL